MFFEIRFDLGTLDSGERSLPFGLLVFHCYVILTGQSNLSINFRVRLIESSKLTERFINMFCLVTRMFILYIWFEKKINFCNMGLC